ncbi:ATP-binding protein [Caldimonas brevitalea]|uniref:Phage related protein n=1 Tax=Caldimonas brevitalea TaxID=413882 RepID=A0A0G3BRP2_9BURK|nr:ATP-binding protein [Caldimonas brevitalea]AKJ30653.1 phage related protein [Caldimonas brevitalea]
MALPIITAEQRLAERTGVKLVLLGRAGVGKTSQLKTLPEVSTLFVDLEAGDLAVKDWRGDTIRPTTWPEFRDYVVFLAGPNRALPAEAPFSQAHFDHVCQRYGDPAQLDKYDCYFVDSLTVLSRWCLAWAKTQPQAFSERTGKPDTRGAYGLLGAEMIGALTQLQHARGKHVVFVAILDERLDDFNRKVFQPQIEGSKTANELPGVVDEVVTLAEIKTEDGTSFRAFVTHNLNPYGYPAKDRSGALDLLEPPDLGALITKCATTHRSFSSESNEQHRTTA